jgi:hypothetical protein
LLEVIGWKERPPQASLTGKQWR